MCGFLGWASFNKGVEELHIALFFSGVAQVRI